MVILSGKITELAGDAHYSDKQTSSQDRIAGDKAAYIIGDTWIHQRMTPVEQWTQIVKALRTHGIEIGFSE